MINRFKLKFGRTPTATSDWIEATPITVFVGPNNSGKSKVLQEINGLCISGQRNLANVVLEWIDFNSIPSDLADKHIQTIEHAPNHGELMQQGHVIVGRKGNRRQVLRQALVNALSNANSNTSAFCSWYLQDNTLILNGQNRINLVNSQQAGDLQKPPQTSLQVLFQDDAKRSEVSRIIHEAFGLFFTIDPTQLGQLRIKLSKRAPTSPVEERGIHREAVKFHTNSLSIEQASDGVKAFTGMITEIIAGDPQILLIDEPEAFLHPALSFQLGKEIASASSSSEKRLFVSTHSPNFVMGCIQSGAPVNIIRLTYRNDVATARLLANSDILRLMRNPLLRSTRVLDALFYEFVIVTESDTDRAFYQEINERLLRFKPEWGIPNCLFLNAQNKQTVKTIIQPLRQLGIPSGGIVDVDILKEGGTVWTDFLKAGFLPEVEQQSLAILRAAIKQKVEATGKNMKLDGGIRLLSGTEEEAANNLFDRLDQYGLFVVRRGEIESWLPQLKAPGHGPTWLIEVFEKMGEEPESQDYLRPETGDVWEFIGNIKKWLTNANRRGIPS